MPMHLKYNAAQDKYAFLRMWEMRDKIDELHKRVPRIMLVHQIYDKCSTELVGRAIKQIYEKDLFLLGAGIEDKKEYE